MEKAVLHREQAVMKPLIEPYKRRKCLLIKELFGVSHLVRQVYCIRGLVTDIPLIFMIKKVMYNI